MIGRVYGPALSFTLRLACAPKRYCRGFQGRKTGQIPAIVLGPLEAKRLGKKKPTSHQKRTLWPLKAAFCPRELFSWCIVGLCTTHKSATQRKVFFVTNLPRFGYLPHPLLISAMHSLFLHIASLYLPNHQSFSRYVQTFGTE